VVLRYAIGERRSRERVAPVRLERCARYSSVRDLNALTPSLRYESSCASCGWPHTIPIPTTRSGISGPLGHNPLRSLPRRAWVFCLARGTRQTGFALCLPQSACNLLSTCLVARHHPALFLGGQNWDFAVAGWPCLYRESSVYITVLRRMISALPGLLITSADWKSAVGTPRRDSPKPWSTCSSNNPTRDPWVAVNASTPAWLSTPFTSCARQSCPGCARQHSVSTLSSANSYF